MDPAHASQEYQADRDAYSSKVPMDPVLRSAMKLRVSTQRASDEAKWFSYAVPSREAFVAAADRRGIKDYDNAWKSGVCCKLISSLVFPVSSTCLGRR